MSRQIEEDTMEIDTSNPVTVIAVGLAIALAGAAVIAVIGGALLDRATRKRRNRPLRIELVQGDITTERVDAIVNAAKSTLLGGGGVDGAIHQAGGPAIIKECRKLRSTSHVFGLPAGQAVATTAGLLPAKWVIHTVGPRFGSTIDRSATLRDCYTASLAEADRIGARTVAFPLISAGIYGWPKEDAIRQALTALRAATTDVETVRLVLFNDEELRLAQDVAGRLA